MMGEPHPLRKVGGEGVNRENEATPCWTAIAGQGGHLMPPVATTIDAGRATWRACVDVGRIDRTILPDLRGRIRCRCCPDWTKTEAAGVGAVDNGVGTQQPTIDGSVEGGRAAGFKTSTTRNSNDGVASDKGSGGGGGGQRSGHTTTNH
jgi:hypothetical protein